MLKALRLQLVRLQALAGRLRSRVPAPSVVLAVVAIALGYLLLTFLVEFPHDPEHWSADLRTAYFSKAPGTQNEDIRIVYITEETLKDEFYTSPINRKLIATLLEKIDAAKPAAIGVDLIFDRPTDRPIDDMLQATIKALKSKTVLGISYDTNPNSQVHADYQKSYLEKTGKLIGHLHFDEHHSLVTISDHVVRFTTEPLKGEPYPNSFASVLAQVSLGREQPVLPRSHYIKWLTTPADGTETFMTLTADQILGNGAVAGKLEALLGGKIVLIGGNFFDRDQHLTPLSVVTEKRFPGLFIHAQILSQLRSQKALWTATPFWLSVMCVVAAISGWWLARNVHFPLLAVEIASVLCLVIIGIVCFRFLDFIFPYTAVFLAWMAGIAVAHSLEKEHN